jgi:hypothetical protein
MSATDMPPVCQQLTCHLCANVLLLQFTDEHGEVCPANWTPGAATMKADPKESLVSGVGVNGLVCFHGLFGGEECSHLLRCLQTV